MTTIRTNSCSGLVTFTQLYAWPFARAAHTVGRVLGSTRREQPSPRRQDCSWYD